MGQWWIVRGLYIILITGSSLAIDNDEHQVEVKTTRRTTVTKECGQAMFSVLQNATYLRRHLRLDIVVAWTDQLWQV